VSQEETRLHYLNRAMRHLVIAIEKMTQEPSADEIAYMNALGDARQELFFATDDILKAICRRFIEDKDR
jgi:hypothetical protein